MSVPAARAALAGRAAVVSLLPPEDVAAEEFDGPRQLAEAFLGAGLTGDPEGFWALMDEIGQRPDRARLETFLAVCSTYLRDLFLLAHGRPAGLTNADRRDALERWLAGVRPQGLEEVALQVDRAYGYLGGNASPQLILADLWRQVNRCRSRASTQGA